MGRKITLLSMAKQEDESHWADLSQVKLMNTGEKEGEILRLRKALREIRQAHLGNAYIDKLANDALNGIRAV